MARQAQKVSGPARLALRQCMTHSCVLQHARLRLHRTPAGGSSPASTTGLRMHLPGGAACAHGETHQLYAHSQ